MRFAGAHLDHVTAGQTAVALCRCGEPIAEYHGDWLHVLNPELRGTHDHWTEPTPETVIRHRHWRPVDGEEEP
jgi:acetone carboxylase gamma subunit